MTTIASSHNSDQPLEAPALAQDSAVFLACTIRSLRRLFRRSDIVVGTVVFPILLLLTMLAVFSSAVESFDAGGGNYAQRLVPGLTVSGLLFGSIGSSVGFFTDLQSGFMTRMRSLPVPAAAPLVGTVAAEGARAALAVVPMAALGHLFGFRFENGPLAALAYVGVAVVIAMCLVWAGLWLATLVSSQEALISPLNALYLVLLFLSQGLVPLEAYPDWIQPVVRVNPASTFVVLLDRLASGGPLVQPTLAALAWAFGIAAVFAALAIRRFRQVV
ncbi:MAG: ABC transporter permease [Actinomycetota bacterium]